MKFKQNNMKDLVKGDKLLRKEFTFLGCEKDKKYTFKEYVLETLIYQIPFINLEEIEGEFSVSHFEKVPKKRQFKVGDKVKCIINWGQCEWKCTVGNILEVTEVINEYEFKSGKWYYPSKHFKLVETPKSFPCTHQSLEDKEEIVKEIIEESPKEFHNFIEEEEEDIYDAVRQFRKDHPQEIKGATKHDEGKPNRMFEGGAVRESEEDKEDYIETISWLALRRYAKYMKKYEVKYGRGNWKKGISIESFERSTMRHLQKYFANKYDGANLEPEVDHLSAALFNIQGLIHELEKLQNAK